MTRDEHIAAKKARKLEQRAARGGERRILAKLRINEISMVTAPASPSFANLIVRPFAHDERQRYEKLVTPPDILASVPPAAPPVAQTTHPVETFTAPETPTMEDIQKASSRAKGLMNAYISGRDKRVSRTQAAEDWRRANPDHFLALQAGTIVPALPAAFKRADAGIAFQKLASDIRQRDQCGYAEAWEKAARENGDAYRALQGA